MLDTVNTNRLQWMVNRSLRANAPGKNVHIHAGQVWHDRNCVTFHLWLGNKQVNQIGATLSDTFSDIVATLENQALNATYPERAYQRQEE